jgi:hypothetical protein
VVQPGVLVEPLHSHPFSFVSYVSVGAMRESVYQETSAPAPSGSAAAITPASLLIQHWEHVVKQTAAP